MICSPTRASLLTGRYHYRTGVVDTYIGRSLMHPDETTLAASDDTLGLLVVTKPIDATKALSQAVEACRFSDERVEVHVRAAPARRPVVGALRVHPDGVDLGSLATGIKEIGAGRLAARAGDCAGTKSQFVR